ncbi:hypothetical protein F4827_000343 [Paraburkholderia bannensis]|uniref:Antirepressor protein C-terminal domain-containing protein n=1 Tax=Paraburkholderia bannensis TaxID=765414 RepID=A0A7W9TT07_9BURK|nr:MULTISPECIES: phage antirepressor KilAC domain-containing protein [Paraburkholderia]MBB3255450.1 hypothetical protein [Paraburkholderia sp. WP4_3_2]MBB6100539.1 hypothetical protein [Paraburkholderia bannensis]
MRASTLEKNASLFAETLRRLGEPEEEVQRRVQCALVRARAGSKLKPGHETVNRYAGCCPITAIARELRMKRADLFERLSREGWLYRTAVGWRATDAALSAGWAVLRGRGVVRWAQLTPTGAQEIARRLGVAPGHFDD